MNRIFCLLFCFSIFTNSCENNGYPTEDDLLNYGLPSIPIGHSDYFESLTNYHNRNYHPNSNDKIFLDYKLNLPKKSTMALRDSLIAKYVITPWVIDSYYYFKNYSTGYGSGYIHQFNHYYSFNISEDTVVKCAISLGLENDTLKKLKVSIWTPITNEQFIKFLSQKYGEPLYHVVNSSEEDYESYEIYVWFVENHEIQLRININSMAAGMELYYTDLNLRLTEETIFFSNLNQKLKDSLQNLREKQEDVKKAINHF